MSHFQIVCSDSLPQGGEGNNRVGRNLVAFLRHGKCRIDCSSIPNWEDVAFQLDAICKAFKTTAEVVFAIVRSCPKQRLVILRDSEDTLWIAAAQGHSGQERQAAAENLMQPMDASNLPPFLFHGTKRETVPLILEQGLSRMKRNHCHMIGPDASSTAPNPDAVSGFRKDSNTIIRIDTAIAMAAGCKFFRSINGVYLTEGVEGIIPATALSILE